MTTTHLHAVTGLSLGLIALPAIKWILTAVVYTAKFLEG
jgi:hypothetical protein